MNYQSVQKSNRLHQLEGLIPRLNQSHPYYQTLNQQLGQDLAGYLGEKNLRYHFEFIQAKEGIHLAGLRLKGRTFFTQIDHLLATPTALFIIEVKNWKGNISENQSGQYVQRFKQTEASYDSPRNQVEIQCRQLEYILRQNNFPNIPIIPLVAFVHDTVQLDTSIRSKDVMVAQNISFYINDHLAENKRRHMSMAQLNRMKAVLMKLETPLKTNLIEKFNIRNSDLNHGVLCPTCRKIFVERIYGTWTCGKCQQSDPTAHIQALRHYANLFQPVINNRTARWWLGIDCHSLTTRLLAPLPRVKDVGRKAVEYDLSSLL